MSSIITHDSLSSQVSAAELLFEKAMRDVWANQQNFTASTLMWFLRIQILKMKMFRVRNYAVAVGDPENQEIIDIMAHMGCMYANTGFVLLTSFDKLSTDEPELGQILSAMMANYFSKFDIAVRIFKTPVQDFEGLTKLEAFNHVYTQVFDFHRAIQGDGGVIDKFQDLTREFIQKMVADGILPESEKNFIGFKEWDERWVGQNTMDFIRGSPESKDVMKEAYEDVIAEIETCADWGRKFMILKKEGAVVVA